MWQNINKTGTFMADFEVSIQHPGAPLYELTAFQLGAVTAPPWPYNFQ